MHIIHWQFEPVQVSASIAISVCLTANMSTATLVDLASRLHVFSSDRDLFIRASKK